MTARALVNTGARQQQPQQQQQQRIFSSRQGFPFVADS